MSITGREFTVAQILGAGGSRVEVPRHQRPYSWERRELRELWEDLTTFSKKYPEGLVKDRQYFMGSIVGQLKSGGHILEVLDGQQRLATLTILLSAIRDTLFAAGETVKAGKVHAQGIAATSSDLDSPDEYILRLSKFDDKFFRETILPYPPEKQKNATPKTASHRALLRARSFFLTAIAEHAEATNQTAVNVAQRMYSIITGNLVVVRVASEKWDDVTDVFERLNDRGKGVSTLDLLRVYLVGRVSSSAAAQADAEAAWSSIYEMSQSAAKVDAFLRHSYITYFGDVKSRSLYKQIKADVESESAMAPFDDPLSLSRSLASDAELYKSISEASHSDDRCAHWLRAINTLGASSLRPAALAAEVSFPEEPHIQANFLWRLVSVFVRWNLIGGGESTELEEATFRAAQIVRSSKDVSKALAEVRPFLLGDPIIKSNFQTLSVLRTGYQRYILEALEDHLEHPVAGELPEKPTSGSGTLWVEHVYPQSPESHWGKLADHDALLNRIGNLTLIRKQLNSAAKNKAFSSKKPYYADSGLKLNKYFSTLESWSPKSIADRQKELSKYVTLIWPKF